MIPLPIISSLYHVLEIALAGGGYIPRVDVMLRYMIQMSGDTMAILYNSNYASLPLHPFSCATWADRMSKPARFWSKPQAMPQIPPL